MEFTNLSEEQKKELKFRHLQAQLLENTAISNIYVDEKEISLFQRYNDIVSGFRDAVIRAKDENGIKKALEVYGESHRSLLDVDSARNREEKKLLQDYWDGTGNLEQFALISRISNDVGITKKINNEDKKYSDVDMFFMASSIRARNKINEVNASFDEKLNKALADELFDEDKNYFNYEVSSVTDIKTLATRTIEEVNEKTLPIQQHPNYQEIKEECLDFMRRFNVSFFQFDISEKESLQDFKRNMSVLKNSIANSCETMGIKENAFGLGGVSFRYYNKDAKSLGTYSPTNNQFSINANSLFNVQKIFQKEKDNPNVHKMIDDAFNELSSVVTHEWAHMLDNKLLNQIKKAQAEQGLTEQAKITRDGNSVNFLSQLDDPVYGISQRHKNLDEAVKEFREIQKSMLNDTRENLVSNEGAKREFMMEFWKGATTLKDSLSDSSLNEKSSLFTEKAFDIVFAYMQNPDDLNNNKNFNKLMKKNDAYLLHSGFFFHGDENAPLKNPLSPELENVHKNMVGYLKQHNQLLDENNKSDFLQRAQLLDVANKKEKAYYSNDQELFARQMESVFFQDTREFEFAYNTLSNEDISASKNNFRSIIAKSFGLDNLTERYKKEFLENNPSFEETKPKPANGFEKFMKATSNFISSIKKTFGINNDEDFQLPLSKKTSLENHQMLNLNNISINKEVIQKDKEVVSEIIKSNTIKMS